MDVTGPGWPRKPPEKRKSYKGRNGLLYTKLLRISDKHQETFNRLLDLHAKLTSIGVNVSFNQLIIDLIKDGLDRHEKEA